MASKRLADCARHGHADQLAQRDDADFDAQ
jgi:hypothetical protein